MQVKLAVRKQVRNKRKKRGWRKWPRRRHGQNATVEAVSILAVHALPMLHLASVTLDEDKT